MERVYRYENALVSVIFPDDFQLSRIQKATKTFLKRILVEERSGYGYRHTS